jgi:hypothetical protein
MYSVRSLMSRFAGTFFIIFVLLPAVNCGKAPSISKDDREAFINTYVELTLARIEYGNKFKMYQLAEKHIFEKNGTSKEFLDSTIARISGNPQLETEIYDEIATRLKKLQDLPPDSLNRYIKTLFIES